MSDFKDDGSDPQGKRWRVGIEKDSEALADRVEKLENYAEAGREFRIVVAETFAELRGKDGAHGSIGEMRRNVDGINSRLWWALTFVLGCLGGMGIKVFMSGREVGRIETKIEQLQRDVEDLRSIAFEREKQ